MSENYTYAYGRRKTSVATVRLYKGKGENVINDKQFTQIYTRLSESKSVELPFKLTNTLGNYYFTAKTNGGGKASQLDAIVLGIARALVKEDETNKPLLKKESLLTRDDRMVERKKTGRRKARKSDQFSKR